MPYQLPDGFPHALSDDDLAGAVVDLNDSLRQRYGNQVGGWLPELQLALISAALSEQSRREVATSNRASKRTARISLAVAAAALFVSAFGAAADYFGDKSWQEDQTRLLTEIRDSLSP
jgi:hypothetical protein